MNRVRSFISFVKLANKSSAKPTNGAYQTTGSFSIRNIQDEIKYQEDLVRLEIEDQFIDHLDYVMSIDNLDQIAFDKKFARKLLKLAETLKKHSKQNRQLITFLEYSKVVERFVDLLRESIECNKTTVVEYYGRRQNESFKAHQDHNLAYCARINEVFTTLIDIIFYASDSRLFRRKFHEFNGTHVLLTYLMQGEFIADSVLAAEIDISANFHILDTLRHLISTIQNLSKTNMLDESLVSAALVSFSQNVKHLDDQLIISYMILSKFLDEVKVESLANLYYVVEKLVYFIKMGANSLEKGDITKRVNIELEKDSQCSACLITYSNLKTDLVEVLDTVFELNLCEYVKFKGVGVFDDLKRIILNGNDTEAEFAVKLLFKFTFDPMICKLMANDEQLKSIVKKIILYQYPNRNLIRYCEGFLWCTENYNRRLFRSSFKSDKLQLEQLKESNKRFDSYNRSRKSAEFKRRIKILISYESANKEFCVRLKNELKNFGIKIWLYDEHLQEYSFEKTMLAIHNSDCILLCGTKRYKSNPSCRLEADYAFENKKPIVPLIMQSQNLLDGWLGNIISNCSPVDFTDDSFEGALKKILEQIDKFVDLKSFGIDIKSDAIFYDADFPKKRQSNGTVNSILSDFNENS